MDSQQFRDCAITVIDMLADYYDNIRDRKVLPSVEPGYLIKTAPENAPEQPEKWEHVLKEFCEIVMPGVTHWHSPQFHAYFPHGSSFGNIIGSLLSEGIAVMGFTWIASPACTELEVVTMNWLGKLLGLPEEFLNCSPGPGGGIIQGSASEAALVGLLAAKDKMVRKLLRRDPDIDTELIKTKFVAYASDQCNSCVEKAGVLGSMKMRLLQSDSNCKLRGETLRKAFEEDKAKGLIPCYVIANLGTTGTCAFDPLYELGPVCKEESVWLHVDAAYAGAACICPEYRYIMEGIEYVDSFDVNVHKWLLVSFDCSAMWVRDSFDLINAFDVQRIYLDDVKSDANVPGSEEIVPDYRHWQMPLGRRFRSLKLWTVLKIHGAEGLRSHIRNHITLAKHFVTLVRADERFVVEPEPVMGLVCFRLKNDDSSTKQLLKNLTAKKEIFMVACMYRGRYVIRFVICSRLTTKEDVEVSWNIIAKETSLISRPTQEKKAIKAASKEPLYYHKNIPMETVNNFYERSK
ncbi:aromatic-L-amino-acid decarboxylase-like isoform X1 [Maniola jurtina]|uniref:aromatic-L-amino-acid decarboxylase-like isoform X1 n=1 Tax=Maniola jurtina TaxID=191418 RepID=UPI001E68F809|nr:aromatic-L-amino-acid decarboxylase-like isoform X1 [Maniola jurtina]